MDNIKPMSSIFGTSSVSNNITYSQQQQTHHYNGNNGNGNNGNNGGGLLTTNVVQKNLYINKEKYNTDYNFYNYNKFKQSRIVPITYRSPTIFLDGLYFKLPKSRLINIEKQQFNMSYTLTLLIYKPTEELKQLFKSIDDYNSDFFINNADKFIYRVIKSNKRLPSLPELSFKAPKRNPLIKKYNYVPFYKIINHQETPDNETILINVSIKHNYLLKIVDLLSMNVDETLNERIKELYDELHREYFELKNSYLNLSLNDINLEIDFWIKASNFIGNEKKEDIYMNWQVCDYKF